MISVDLPQTLTPSLPQDDDPEEQAARKKALALAQEQYRLTTEPLGIVILKTPLPNAEIFSDQYNAERGEASLPMIENTKKVGALLTDPLGPFSGLGDYENMYIDLPKPLATKGWLTDERFGEQRLSGANPVVIQRVIDKNSFPDKLDMIQLKNGLNSTIDLDKLIANKQLYSVDLASYLESSTEGKVTGTPIQKYLPKPIGLFYWEEDSASLEDPAQKSGRLLPLAIQVDVKDDHVKIYTPENSELLWTIAKMCFAIADANVHEMATHLGIAHFAQEPFGAITPRELAEKHPIAILLKPHLRFLVYNNQQGLERLVQPGGPVDKLLASTLEDSLAIAVKASKTFSVMASFPELIKARNMSSDESIPHYPFRDDGLLIWDAIVNYVNDYIGIYYKTNADISEDCELQSWTMQLADPKVGNVKDMPVKIENAAQLSQILSVIIFTASAGHSSVNYTQYPYMGFSPNMALAGYKDYREFLVQDSTPKEQLQFMLNFLPPQVLALGQIRIMDSLSNYHYDSLGDYTKQLTDPLAKQALYRFVQKLDTIEQKINIRNRHRAAPYTFLLPSVVLNSASI